MPKKKDNVSGTKILSQRPTHTHRENSENKKKSIIQTTLISSERKLAFCTTLKENNSRPLAREGSNKKGNGRFHKIENNFKILSHNHMIRRPIDVDQIDQPTQSKSILSYFKPVTSNLSND